MKHSDVHVYRCPNTHQRLSLKRVDIESDGEIKEGLLVTEDGKTEYPVVRGIPRFVPPDNYAASFGYQWNKFAKVQVGGVQKEWSKTRFDQTTEWPGDLRGQRILEAGCGAGRFTEIALDTGAEVFSFDLSAAVEACNRNLLGAELRARHHAAQASIYAIPFPAGTFDKVYCLGVLQHCPDVKRAFMSLVPLLKPGGEIVVDCYLSQPLKHAFNLKYLLRPFFKWWRPTTLYAFWSCVISVAYDLKRGLNALPGVGPVLARIVPIGRLNYEAFGGHQTIDEIKEIKTLSVFDMLSPAYDQPQSLKKFRAWIAEANLELIKLDTGYNGINAKARMAR